MLGGNYVNRFSIQGRSYKVIPQVKRVERLTAGSAVADLREGINRQARSALDICHLADNDRAAIAEQVSAAERGAHSGCDSADVAAR